jgi:FixJ family two-component response regulator
VSAKHPVVAVIDDNLQILGAMSRLLSAYGYDTELYASPKEFLDAVMMTEAICLIVDIQLGDSCGVDLVRHLASIGIKFPTIFMTTNDSEALRQLAEDVGCIGFLRKPFSAEALVETLAKLPPRKPH